MNNLYLQDIATCFVQGAITGFLTLVLTKTSLKRKVLGALILGGIYIAFLEFHERMHIFTALALGENAFRFDFNHVSVEYKVQSQQTFLYKDILFHLAGTLFFVPFYIFTVKWMRRIKSYNEFFLAIYFWAVSISEILVQLLLPNYENDGKFIVNNLQQLSGVRYQTFVEGQLVLAALLTLTSLYVLLSSVIKLKKALNPLK